MTWYPVGDEVAFGPQFIAAGNAAVGLWTRAGSWSTLHLTDGHIPSDLARAMGTKAEIAALVRNDLWAATDDGYQFTPWNGLTRDGQSRAREAAAARQRVARSRKRHAVTPDVTPAVTRDSRSDAPGDNPSDPWTSPAQSSPNAAAAAKRGRAAARSAQATAQPSGPARGLAAQSPAGLAVGLPADPAAHVAVDILSERACASGLVVRWDTLTDDEVTEVAELVTLHGDQALITAASIARTAHTTPAVSARAWLGLWRAMPPPGRHLHAVPETRCPHHDTEPAKACRSCRADRLAGEA